ncbi:unnamed protein product [Brassica napus]|uniref:(rape) hypothetical protein n=1 Tax=Brassica napus TaxID=3708 RepID=A0A816TZA3_BRANA|nr:unnamed protein product [Brassica napus]
MTDQSPPSVSQSSSIRESTPLENEPPELSSPPINLRTRDPSDPPRWKERKLQRHHQTTTTPSRCS